MNSDDQAALAFAEEQLALAEAATGEQNEMAGLHTKPSAGQGFLYITDRFGRVTLDRDSAFICSRIQFIGVDAVAAAASYLANTTLSFSVRNAGASILLTITKARQGVSLEVAESEFAPVGALVPQGRNSTLLLGQVDYVYTLSARLIFPRGSTIVTAFPDMPANGFTSDGLPIRQFRPQLLFVGRKVFG